MITFKLSSALAIVATIDPVVVTTAEVFTDVVDMSRHDQLLALVLSGDMAAAATMDFKFYGCDSDGNNATAAVKAATQRAADASNNDGIQIEMIIRAIEMPAAKPRWGKFGIVSASTGGPMAVIVFSVAPRYAPSATQLATMVEAV